MNGSVEALVHADGDLARKVIDLDISSGAMQRAIEEDAIVLIARRQPVAYDLRVIVAV